MHLNTTQKRNAHHSSNLLFVFLGLCIALNLYCIREGYTHNHPKIFWASCGTFVIFLIVLSYKTFLRRYSLFPIITNTITLFFLALFVLNPFMTEFLGEDFAVEKDLNVEKSFSYHTAKGNPLAFRKWWREYVNEWYSIKYKLEKPDPSGHLPFLLIPNASVRFMDGRININSLGFRNKEFDVNKNEQFRIVAIGESTTFGATISKNDIPWPAILEKQISEKMDCEVDIEVINAGVESYNLENNLNRLQKDVLPLQPDMIISYHGFNGFSFIIDSLESMKAKDVPIFDPARPSRLLALVEYRFNILIFKMRYFNENINKDGLQIDDDQLLNTPYAELYRELIDIAQTNGIPLVLCSFNMAVNQNSPEDVIQFYKAGFPRVRVQILANALHNRMLKLLSDKEHFIFADTSSQLDGEYTDKYIDLVHFTQKGRNQLARNIYHSIKQPLLDAELGCREREEQNNN